MYRMQIGLTDAQYERLRSESASSGHSLAELIRHALDECHETVSKADRLALLDSAFGARIGRCEDGAEFVERVRTGTARRVSANT